MHKRDLAGKSYVEHPPKPWLGLFKGGYYLGDADKIAKAIETVAAQGKIK